MLKLIKEAKACFFHYDVNIHKYREKFVLEK